MRAFQGDAGILWRQPDAYSARNVGGRPPTAPDASSHDAVASLSVIAASEATGDSGAEGRLTIPWMASSPSPIDRRALVDPERVLAYDG